MHQSFGQSFNSPNIDHFRFGSAEAVAEAAVVAEAA